MKTESNLVITTALFALDGETFRKWFKIGLKSKFIMKRNYIIRLMDWFLV